MTESVREGISLAGVYPPVPTPFDDRGEIARQALTGNLARWNQYALGGDFPTADFAWTQHICCSHGKWYQSACELEGNIPLLAVDVGVGFVRFDDRSGHQGCVGGVVVRCCVGIVGGLVRGLGDVSDKALVADFGHIRGHGTVHGDPEDDGSREPVLRAARLADAFVRGHPRHRDLRHRPSLADPAEEQLRRQRRGALFLQDSE